MECLSCNLKTTNKYCSRCGKKVPASTFETVVTQYFRKGFTYNEILDFLRQQHGVKMCVRTLKKKIKSFDLKRKSFDEEHLAGVVDAVRHEIDENSGSIGYRTMWHKLSHEKGINAPRDLVMKTMRDLDPQGSSARKAKRLKRRHYKSNGPNYLWHVDGYDKLKPFGFPIHGCIDGFSRKILWLRVLKSNNDPVSIATVYLEKIEQLGFFPKCVRTDCGTENGILAASQCYFSRDHDTSVPHMYGSSHHNQRIEAWWSQLRRLKTNFMIDMFKDLVNSGLYNCDDELQKACCQFCFGPLIQAELESCKEQWNCHYIRKSESSEVYGRPDHLYLFPKENFTDHGITVAEDDVAVIKDYLTEYGVENKNEQGSVYFEYFYYLFSKLNLPECTDFNIAKTNFLRMLEVF